jgi:hypothetical protein
MTDAAFELRDSHRISGYLDQALNLGPQARERRFEAQCAVKFLGSSAGQTRLVERFRYESGLLARLGHPNVARRLTSVVRYRRRESSCIVGGAVEWSPACRGTVDSVARGRDAKRVSEPACHFFHGGGGGSNSGQPRHPVFAPGGVNRNQTPLDSPNHCPFPKGDDGF